MPVIYLVRHGQASFGAEDYDNLSELGVKQSAVLGESLKASKVLPTGVVCGRMRRHAQTAEACLEAMGLPPFWQEEPGLDEFDHTTVIAQHRPELLDREATAAWLAKQDNPRRAFQKVFEEALAQWMRGEGEYTESWAEFRARVVGSMEHLAESLGSGDSVLAFTSGGPISVAVQSLMGLADEQLPHFNRMLVNASVTRVAVSGSGLRVASVNEHLFLPQELTTYR